MAVKVHQLAPGWGEARRASYVKHAVRVPARQLLHAALGLGFIGARLHCKARSARPRGPALHAAPSCAGMFWPSNCETKLSGIMQDLDDAEVCPPAHLESERYAETGYCYLLSGKAATCLAFPLTWQHANTGAPHLFS